jgi:hypothetical protein
MKYGWDEEVIVMVNAGESSEKCSENGGPEKEDPRLFTDKKEWEFLANGNVFQNTADASIYHKKFDCSLKARYRGTPLGWDLYCKVVLREKTQSLTGNSNGDVTFSANWNTANVPVKLVWQRRYKRKCKEDTGFQEVESFGTGTATGQSWQGLRPLNKYVLGASAYAKVNGNWELMVFGPANNNVNGSLYQVMINHGY